MLYTRRELGKLALAGVPATGFLLKSESLPRGRQAELQMGGRAGRHERAVPTSGTTMITGEDARSRVSTRRQRGRAAVAASRGFLGVPATWWRRGRAAARRRTRRRRRPARKSCANGGSAVPMSQREGIPQEMGGRRRRDRDRQVRRHLQLSDDVLDYAFNLAKNLGARAISCEIDVPKTKRVGQFADKHKLMVGYHGHAETGPEHWEEAFTFAKHNGANLDIGHFIGGQKTSPVPFLKKHHDRITHIHVKDKKLRRTTNVPFGRATRRSRKCCR